jgi:protein N-terminal glutamine amidohydrolase
VTPPDPSLYQPFYCEENVFHLCREARFGGRRREVVFISNRDRTCVMWHQRAGGGPGAHVFWDYHVVLLARAPWEIWDLDTTLGLPVPAAHYLARSFRDGLPPGLMPRFRLIDAELFATTFSSDRAHMRRPGGSYRKPPPPWPPIGPPGAAPNLMRFVDVEQPFAGEIVDLSTLRARVAAEAP